MEKPLILFLNSLCKNYGINKNISDKFFYNEKLIERKDYYKDICKFFKDGDDLEIENEEYEEKIIEEFGLDLIKTQEVNGLWLVNDKNIKLLNFNDKKEWEECIKINEKLFKDIFNMNMIEEILLNILFIHYLKEQKKVRFNLIIKKCVKALLKKYKELNENKIMEFENKIIS